MDPQSGQVRLRRYISSLALTGLHDRGLTEISARVYQYLLTKVLKKICNLFLATNSTKYDGIKCMMKQRVNLKR